MHSFSSEKMKIFQLGKPLSYFKWEESVKRTVYGLANTLTIYKM
jgi:hypothetical protein